MQWESDHVELDQAEPMQMAVRPKCLDTLTNPGSPASERFRNFAIRLKSFQRRQRLQKLLITSSVKGEGKSVISANLAVTLAQTQRTLLIDCDLHQSGLRDVLGVHGQPGIGEWWRHSRSAVNFLRRLDGLSLSYLSAGHVTEQPVEILQSERFAEMLNQMSRWFDWVIVDSPPLLPVADSGLLADQVDAALLVVRQGHTPKPLLKEALKTENLKLLGIIGNQWQVSTEHYYNEYYKGYMQHSSIDEQSSGATAKAS